MAHAVSESTSRTKTELNSLQETTDPEEKVNCFIHLVDIQKKIQLCGSESEPLIP